MRMTLNSLLLMTLLTPIPALAQDAATPRVPSIVTTGEAVLRLAPDQAFVTVAVETRARNPRDAQRQNADAMTSVQKRIADAGISGNALRTTGYSIHQEFDFPDGRRRAGDYVARNGVEVRVDDIDRTGEILDAVVASGATSVTGVRFDLKDRAEAERDALREAVEDARARADALAAGVGRRVDAVLHIDDSRAPRVALPQPMYRMAAAADSAQTPIEAGLVEVRAQVVLTVSIK
jgi:uncharacterized protein YggE